MTIPTDTTLLPRFASLRELPPGYTRVERLSLESPRTVLLLNLFGLLGIIPGLLFFLLVDRALYALNLQPAVDVALFSMNGLLVVCPSFILMILIMVVHELCHGLAFRLFGAPVRYGMDLSKGVLFATADGYYFTRDAYIVIGLAPLVLITIGIILCMVVAGGSLRVIIALMGVVNMSGAAGDIWFVTVCLRYPRTLIARDLGDSVELFSRQSDSSPASAG
ncbi:MAG: DUF3267 domain-containing protein [Anaerolineae bacterium]|nr:DUF3267 domain-containing protein [Anaerolineae bacterium]